MQSERGNSKFSIFRGEMAEWSIAAVLKTVEVRASGGSNPSLSAINLENQGLNKQVHEKVHKNALKQMFLGRFLIKKKKPYTYNRVQASPF